jgi:hypothetical protein
MQVQTNIIDKRITSHIGWSFLALVVLILALLPAPAYSNSDLGRGAGRSSQTGTSPVPLPQTPVMWGNVNPEKHLDVVTGTGNYETRKRFVCSIVYKFRGEFTLPFHPEASIDSRGCLLKKSWPSSNPYWPAHELPPAWIVPNAGTRSMSGTSCNSGQALIPTGRQACCSFARFTMMAGSAELCCGRIGADIARRGTHTAVLKSCASAEPRFRPLRERSTTQATLRIALDVTGKTGSNERSIRYRNLIPTVPNECRLAGFQPDNEHHAALCRSP